MFKYGCQSSYLSRKSFLFGKRARKKSCNCSDSPASLRVGNQWSFLFVVFAGLPLLPFCHFTIVPASPVCSFAGFAAFAVLLFRRFAVLPFRRFVVFMVLPLGGFHGSAVLQLCHAPPHIILNKSRTLRVPVHVAACPEGGTPAFI